MSSNEPYKTELFEEEIEYILRCIEFTESEIGIPERFKHLSEHMANCLKIIDKKRSQQH